MRKNKLNLKKWVVIAGLALLVKGLGVNAASNPDKKIESSAKNSVMFKDYLSDDTIRVKSEQGVVTLTGTVSSPAHKSMAEKTVENVAGVKSVNNQLAVQGGQVEESSDGWIETKVKTTLLFHRNVNGLKTRVAVKDGIVTLQGEAESSAQKDLTTEYAKDIDGVKYVNNDMVVKTTSKSNMTTLGDKIDDASITAQTMMVLLYHRSTSALHTNVKTHDRIVMVSGEARNDAEKDLVTKLVKDIRGVKDVQNNMTVAPETKK